MTFPRTKSTDYSAKLLEKEFSKSPLALLLPKLFKFDPETLRFLYMACPEFPLVRTKGKYLKKPVLVMKDNWYIGEVTPGFIPHGLGHLLKADGSYYEGYFKDGVFEGKGRIFLQSGQVCEGIWSAGQLDKGNIFYSKEKVYTGNIKNLQPHGEGFEKSQDYDYEGSFENGLKHGNGKVLWNDDNQYEGQFFKGKIEGIGKHSWDDRVYQGQWKANKMHGFGKISWNDGRTYEGHVFNGAQEGFGIMIDNHRKYSGYWKDGREDGKGTLEIGEIIIKGIWHKGKIVRKFSEARKSATGKMIFDLKHHEKYRKKFKKIIKIRREFENFFPDTLTKTDFLEGNWKKLEKGLYKGEVDEEGNPSGIGVFLNSFEIYEGDFKSAQRSGYGRLVTIEREVYIGGWLLGLKSGFGSLKAKDSRYEGDWKAGLFHGEGKLTSCKFYYSGSWKKGRENGIGSVKYHDGSSYVGEFVKGQITGIGTFTYPDGNSLKGKWLDGKFLENFENTTEDSEDQDVIETVRSIHCIRFKEALLNY
jgi:hypothetical protein